jgi:hypothetical protein
VHTLLPRWLRSAFWIRNNLDWHHVKPVLRSTVCGWVSLLLLLGEGSLRVVGTVSSVGFFDVVWEVMLIFFFVACREGL